MRNIFIPFYVGMIIISFVTSCDKPRLSRLEQALTQSGSNRIELEKVISHYSYNKSDSLKRRAAIFLIENMPGHYSYYGKPLDTYLDSINQSASLRNYPWHLRNMFMIQAYRKPDILKIKGVQKIEDAQMITADYLIDNIERAFIAWKKPWARHLCFNDFCEYLLPYRVENEPLMHWRDSLDGAFNEVFTKMETVDELFESPYQACLQLNTTLMESFQAMKKDSVTFFHPLTGEQKAVKFGCPEFVYAVIFVMRSMGIPISIESIEQWSSRRGKHFWNAVYHFTGLHYPFTGYDSRPRGLNQDYKMNKVYRYTYAANPEALVNKLPTEPIPSLFRNPFVQDVTKEYMICHDIAIQLSNQPTEKRQYAYLCVFDNEKWIPVHWGRIHGGWVTFTEVGPQTMFVAGYYIDGEIIPASFPFHVDLEGGIHFIYPTDSLQTLYMERKYPLFHRFANYSRHLIGATVEASDFPDFRNSHILATFSHDANTMWDSIAIDSSGSHRYIRLQHTKKMELAELEFYANGQDRPLSINRILLPSDAISDKKEQLLFNGSIGDFTEINQWIGFDLGRDLHLGKVRYCPRTDDNHIIAGDMYELYIYENNGFKPLKKKVADNYIISFDSIPSSGLYLLKDMTKGREHRIFTYVNRKAYFW